MAAMAKKSGFTQMIDDTLIHTIDDDLVINVGTIKALIPLMSQGIIERDQLQIIITVLDDATVQNRLALHDLLSQANFSDSMSVTYCLKKLLQSLKRFPMDKFSIYRCIGEIGKRHALMIQALVAELLEIHPIFDTPEQNIDDDFYLAKLILVLNAASQHSVICSLIPQYVQKHYRYLIRSWPNLIPPIEEFEEKNIPLIELPAIMNTDTAGQLWNTSGTTGSLDEPKDKLKTIRIFEPTREFQDQEVVRFIAGLPTGIFVRCMLENVTDEELDKLRFQIEYPDQTIDYHRPRRAHFLRLNPTSVHLQTDVIVSAQRWAIPANVIFTVGLCSKGFLQTSVKSGKDAEHFVPLKLAEHLDKNNRISVNIHPTPQ